MKMRILWMLGGLLPLLLNAQHFVVTAAQPNVFPVVDAKATVIYVDETENVLVKKSAQFLQKDIAAVTGKKPEIIHAIPSAIDNIIIVGTVSGSSVIGELTKNKIVNAASVQNKWEAYMLQTLTNPFKNVKQALVIIGSDRRGAAYGVFELSKQMGVSPWCWWADVPVSKKTQVFVKNGTYNYASPSVKYRGIFINDEEPAFGGWAREKFGGINSVMYGRMFELILRLKGNYLWPAMWGKAFNEDDPENPRLADEYGIVMGTSHHEPMMRSQKEWGIHKKEYGNAAWNYHTNKDGLLKFWEDGIRRNKAFDNMVTLGMRGDGDEPMHDMGSKKANYEQLEGIISDQRKIIENVTAQSAKETPQVWALYKEVQEYYDMGMKVPDDVTLLLCDDNWGNIRRLPSLEAPKRTGGYGIYYHFDYVGGPRSYRWLNTNNIARVWEQMNLAYDYGVDKIWIVNVGDLKPMELPTAFFLDMAWDAKRWNETNINDYYTYWATEQFGPNHARAIGEIMKKYAIYAARRKPEFLDAKSYSIENYDEAERVTNDWNILLKEAEALNNKMPTESKDAFFQLVLHPIKAYGNLQNMYTALAWNQFYAKQNNVLANEYADKVKQFYINDSLITLAYHQLNNGKWNRMMAQKHIGYTSWQEPRVQAMPQVTYIEKGTRSEPVQRKEENKTALALIPKTATGNIFFEKDGYVSIHAVNYTRKKEIANNVWKTIPGIGREGDAIALYPDLKVKPGNANALASYVEYEIYTYSKGAVKVEVLLSPSLNFNNTEAGLRYTIQVNEETPQTVAINPEAVNSRAWTQWVGNNIISKTTRHAIATPGKQTIRIYAKDPGVVIQKIILNSGGVKPSYLGPPETSVKNIQAQ